MELRDYQVAALGKVAASFRANHRRVILTMPTGAGKTIAAVAMAATAVENGHRVLVLVHRQELLRQMEAALTAFGLNVGVVWKDRKERGASVVITTIQNRKPIDVYGPDDLIIVDECHHAVSKTWQARLDAHTARVLGLTATPERRDGRGLGEVFHDLVVGRRVDELIIEGALCGFRVLAPKGGYDMSNARRRMGDYIPEDAEGVAMDRVADVVLAVKKHAVGRKSLVFCVSIAHAERTREQMRGAGIACDLLTGGNNDRERRDIEQQFRDGSLDALISVDLFSEGYDCPECDCVVLARPTTSLSTYLQQVGRGMRPADNKTDLLILDCARNSERLGFPDTHRKWTLVGKRKPAGERAIALWTCKECFSVHRAGTMQCKHCGYEREITSRLIKESPEVLVEIAHTHGDDKAGYMAALHGKTIAYAYEKHPDDMDAALALVEQIGSDIYRKKMTKKDLLSASGFDVK